MNRKLIAVLIANLFIAPVALAQSDFKLDGNVGLGGLYSSDSSTRDRAKLEEYQDLSNGAAGYFGFRGAAAAHMRSTAMAKTSAATTCLSASPAAITTCSTTTCTRTG